jgi:hypothetical protein
LAATLELKKYLMMSELHACGRGRIHAP